MENQLAEVSIWAKIVEEFVYFRKSSLVSLDQLFIGDAKGQA